MTHPAELALREREAAARGQRAILIVLGLGFLLLVPWVGSVVFEPRFITPSEDANQIYFHRRHWFGSTTMTPLWRRFDTESKTWVWMAKDSTGRWYPFFGFTE